MEADEVQEKQRPAELADEAGDYFVETVTRIIRENLLAVVRRYAEVGMEPSEVLGEPEEFAERVVRATAPEASPWDELAGPFMRSEGVQARLGISRQAVASKAGRRRLLRTVTADDVHLYPVWQFDGPRVLDGLTDVLGLFPEAAVDGWTLAGWLRTPDPELGESPYDALARGEVDRVRAVARGAALALGT